MLPSFTNFVFFDSGTELLNLYLFGSRLCGVEKPDSDYDFVGICEGKYFYAYRLYETTVPAELSPTGEELSVSINLQHTTYFKETLKDAFINSVMLLYLPTDFVFMELYDIRAGYILHYPNLRQSIQMDSTHNAAKAKRLWRELDFYTAKKNVLHGIRYLNYAIQVLETGSINDFKAGNEFFRDIMNWEEPSGENSESKKFEHWRALEGKYSPLYTELTTYVREFCQKSVDTAMSWEKRWIATHFKINEKVASTYHLTHLIPQDILIDYLNEFGLPAAARDFGITVTAHSEQPDLITLGRTQMASMELSIVQWASGIVLKDISIDKSRSKWQVIAAPLPKIFAITSSKDVVPAIPWSNSESIYLEEHLDGTMALLYNYEGKWFAASKSTPDGSDLLGWVCPIRHENWKELVTEGFNFNPVHEANMLVELRPGLPNPTFAEHFWDVFGTSGLSTASFNPLIRYIFEFQTPFVKNVVEHQSPSLVLLAARDDNGTEIDITPITKSLGLATTKKLIITEESKASPDPIQTSPEPAPLAAFPTSLDLLYTSLRFLDPTISAGYIVRLKTGVRVAIRSPQFDALTRLHPLSDYGLTQKLLLELVKAPYPRTWLSLGKYGFWVPKYDEMNNTYQSMCTYFQRLWNQVRAAAKVSRADAAAILVEKPLGFAELFLLIKLERLDADIRDHFTLIPNKRLHIFLKQYLDPKTLLATLPASDPTTKEDSTNTAN